MMQEQELYDIYGLVHVPFWQRTWFVWMIFTLILLLIASAVLYLILYRRKKKVEQVPYWIQILRDIEFLSGRPVVTIEQGSALYTRLTHLLRAYLEQRYNYDFKGKTDVEVMIFLEQSSFDPQYMNIIRSIFEGGTYIKFAHVHAATQQIEQDLQLVVAFVQATHPRPERQS